MGLSKGDRVAVIAPGRDPAVSTERREHTAHVRMRHSSCVILKSCLPSCALVRVLTGCWKRNARKATVVARPGITGMIGHVTLEVGRGSTQLGPSESGLYSFQASPSKAIAYFH